MRFFMLFMFAGFAISLFFLLHDESGSGMGWGVGIFAGIGIGVALYNKLRFGSVFRDGLNDQNGPQ